MNGDVCADAFDFWWNTVMEATAGKPEVAESKISSILRECDSPRTSIYNVVHLIFDLFMIITKG